MMELLNPFGQTRIRATLMITADAAVPAGRS